MNAFIRISGIHDAAAVRSVNEAAFGRRLEADLVERLCGRSLQFLSLVAEDAGQAIVGHILFTSVTIEHAGGVSVGMGLAPMAVRPECQRQGIGSALVRRGLSDLQARSCPFVVVVGHPAYYPRFGFVRASMLGIESQWSGIPDEAFMVLILDRAVMDGVRGIARYRDEFDSVV